MSNALGTKTRVRKQIRVAVADDEETIVDVLRTLIGSDPALRFAGGAYDAERAIELVAQERPQVVLVDVRMPGGGGLRAVREIAKRFPSTKVVALSAHDDLETVLTMISAGVSAYVSKAESTDKILEAIHRSVGGPAADLPVMPSPVMVDERSARVGRVILDGAITAEFEPVVNLETGQVVGLEARPRIATLPFRTYDTWRADAEAAGLLLDLEVAAFRVALRALRDIPQDLFLEFEVSAASAAAGRFRQAVRRDTASRIVLGFARFAPADEPDVGALSVLRAKGVRVAARDVGPGMLSLRHLTAIRPEFARLDPTLTLAAGMNLAGHAIVAAIVACAEQVGASVIADCVSSEEQLQELARVGVRYVQGPRVGSSLPFSLLRGGLTDRGTPSSPPHERADDRDEGSILEHLDPGGDEP